MTTRLPVIGLAVIVAACATERATTPQSASAVPDNAYTSLPAGYSQALSSFSPSADSAMPWVPGQPGVPGGPGGPGGGVVSQPIGGPGGSGLLGGLNMWAGAPLLMGGGLGPPFVGMSVSAVFGGRPFDDGVLPASCTFSAATGFVTCPTLMIDGLTVNRSAQYTDAGGTAHARFDSTTNTVLTQISVAGTLRGQRHGGGFGVGSRNGPDVTPMFTDTTTINESSSRTVSGLAAGSTQRTVNGASSGVETTSGTSSENGHFTADRTVGDTTTGLVEPIQPGHMTYPTAGTIVRSMQVTLTFDGQTPITTSRREVVTYDGTSTATIVITQDGTTKTCTMPLPIGRVKCQ